MKFHLNNVAQWFRNGGFRKPPSPHLATVEAEPGKTTLTLTRNGEPFALLVLTEVVMGFDSPTTAVFKDKTVLMEKWSYRP